MTSEDDKDDDSSFELAGEEEIDDEDDEVDKVADNTVTSRVTTSPSVSRQPKRRDYENSSDEEKRIPSIMRRTDRGGYAHTAKSRQRIGDANRGNTPWNKGKNRSEIAKQRIAAGVRARNDRILMANLEKIGLPHEEYKTVKLELKYMRERVRKARIAEKGHLKRKELEKEKLRKIQQDSWKIVKEEEKFKPPDPVVVEEIVYETESSEEEDGGDDDVGTKDAGTNPIFPFQEPERQDESTSFGSVLNQVGHAAMGGPVGDGGATDYQQQTEIGKKDQPVLAQHMPSVLRKDILWERNDFDDEENEKYSDYCPVGGPGGLMCCSACTSLYSDFLMETHKNLESQKTIHIGWQVETMTSILEETKDRLKKSLHAARLQPPPSMSAKGKTKDRTVTAPLGSLQDDSRETSTDTKDPPGSSVAGEGEESSNDTKGDPPGKKRKADTKNDQIDQKAKRGKAST